MEHWPYYIRGRLWEAFSRYSRALDEYAAALRAKPDFHRAANRHAYVLASQLRFAESEPYFRLVLQLDPDNASAHFNLGFTLEKLGRYEQAIQEFQTATRLHPKFDRAWYGLGMCQAQLGRHELAVEALEHAAILQQMNPHAWYALGMAHHAVHSPDKVKAVALHLVRFDPRMARRLIRDAERADLNYLVKDLAV